MGIETGYVKPEAKQTWGSLSHDVLCWLSSLFSLHKTDTAHKNKRISETGSKGRRMPSIPGVTPFRARQAVSPAHPGRTRRDLALPQRLRAGRWPRDELREFSCKFFPSGIKRMIEFEAQVFSCVLKKVNYLFIVTSLAKA